MPQLSEGLWPDSLSSGEFPEAQGRVEAHRSWLSARRVCRSADFGAERPSVALLAELVHRLGLFQVQPAQQLLDVFGEDVALQIDARADAPSAPAWSRPGRRSEDRKLSESGARHAVHPRTSRTPLSNRKEAAVRTYYNVTDWVTRGCLRFCVLFQDLSLARR